MLRLPYIKKNANHVSFLSALEMLKLPVAMITILVKLMKVNESTENNKQ